MTKKNPHHAIKRGALIEEAKVWFYFICSVIVSTDECLKHSGYTHVCLTFLALFYI